MLLAAGSALVAGSTPDEENPMNHVYIRALRAFYLHGKVVPVGAVVQVSKLFAAEMVSAKKAEITEAPQPPKAKGKPDAE